MTGAMILVTIECRRARMQKNELERSVDLGDGCFFGLGVFTEKVGVALRSEEKWLLFRLELVSIFARILGS
jgi:hypothetical protein